LINLRHRLRIALFFNWASERDGFENKVFIHHNKVSKTPTMRNRKNWFIVGAWLVPNTGRPGEASRGYFQEMLDEKVVEEQTGNSFDSL